MEDDTFWLMTLTATPKPIKNTWVEQPWNSSPSLHSHILPLFRSSQLHVLGASTALLDLIEQGFSDFVVTADPTGISSLTWPTRCLVSSRNNTTRSTLCYRPLKERRQPFFFSLQNCREHSIHLFKADPNRCTFTITPPRIYHQAPRSTTRQSGISPCATTIAPPTFHVFSHQIEQTPSINFVEDQVLIAY